MIRKRLSFSNAELDDFGYPTNYSSYIIIGRQVESGESANKSDGIAKIYTLSNQSIAPSKNHFVAVGGAENAVNLAVAELRKLNPGLNERICMDDQP